MSRGRKRKSEKGTFTELAMKNAVKDVISNGMRLRKTAERNGVKFQTLARYVKKQKHFPKEDISMKPRFDTRRVFNDAQEKLLMEYIFKCAKMCYGKSTKDVRVLAYELAIHNDLKYPKQWKSEKRAAKDWLSGFMMRNPRISIRQPEGCSLSRATSFNRHNVNLFYDNLDGILRKSDYSHGSRIFNLDETATTTVQKSCKILAQKGMKQVNKCTSGERGVLVTTCCIISATGNTVPPALVFPRTYYKNHMINGAPPGTLGLANSSGWMTCELFVKVMEHFIKYTSSSKTNPSLLIMDNHESHLSIASIDMAKEHGVTVLTLPPHCSHKLQPLDVSVYAPLKAHYNAAIDSWMLRNPGVPITIYQIAECVGIAFERGMTPANIKSGFKKTGIFPFDRNIFTDDDFLISKVTDRELEIQQNETNHSTNAEAGSSKHGPISLNEDRSESGLQEKEDNEDEIQETETVNNERGKTKILSTNENILKRKFSEEFTSPEDLFGLPKALPRKSGVKKSRKGSSKIVTDTPEKKLLEEKEKEKERRI